MTPSEKPEQPASQPEKDAKSGPASTQTVEDTARVNVESQGAAAGQADPASGSAESDPAEGPAPGTPPPGPSSQGPSSQGDVVPDAAEAPPPWQRTSVTGGQDAQSGHIVYPSPPEPSGYTGVSQGPVSPDSAGPGPDAVSSESDTQKIPKSVQDQDTLRTGVPTVAAAFGNEGSESAQASRSSVSFSGAGAGRSGSESNASGRRPSRGPRRASLQVKRVDPWSVLKLALVLSVALFFAWMIAVAVLYGVLDGMKVWDQLNGTFSELMPPEDAGTPLISAGRVFAIAAIIGGINIVLMTALATVGAFIYNVAADFAGGVELTLSERE